MKLANRLALVVAFYLSKFDRLALEQLGFSSFTQAFNEVGQCLGVNPNTVKNMRDEYDPIHDNARVGWHQRPLRPSRREVLQAFSGLAEATLRDIVIDILEQREAVWDDVDRVICSMEVAPNKTQRTGTTETEFVPRGITGKQAETVFMDEFHSGNSPFAGCLVDKRELGVGYDYLVENQSDREFVGVKGLAGTEGSITLTDKEWQVAKEKGEEYHLCVVFNVDESPEISYISNPGSRIDPRRHMSVSVRITWSVDSSTLP